MQTLIPFFRNLEAGKKQTVIVYGTSLTLGGAWAVATREWFDHHYPGQVTFLNSAMGGMHSDWGLANVQERVAAHHPDLVFIEFSFNDAFDEFAMPIERGAANLDGMVKAIRAQSPEVVFILQIMSVPWDSPAGNGGFTKRLPLQDCNENYRRYARENGLLLLDHYWPWQCLKETERERYQSLVPDGTHPSKEGSLAITWPTIRALLESSRHEAR